jgi:hypothetical protein
VNHAFAGAKTAFDVHACPILIDQRKHALNLSPCGALPANGGAPDSDNKEVEIMIRAVCDHVHRAINHVAETGQEREQQPGWIRFCFWQDALYDLPGQSVIGICPERCREPSII